jgi:two-component system phosphate regulon sensor histidine kinase PhoR
MFLASLGVAAAALAVLAVIVAYERRQDERTTIELRLVSQAQLIAELLTRNAATASDQDLDDEADRLAQLIGARVTLIAADGTVLGDSDLDGQALSDVENHAQRPEVQKARDRWRRHRSTVQHDCSHRDALCSGDGAAIHACGMCASRCP